MGINIFFKNTHQSEQLPLKEEVLLGNWVVKAKSLAVSFLSNSSLKKIIWAFLRFYLYFMFKINIFMMQLLKNDTANLVSFKCFWSNFISSFRKSCPLWCVILIRIHFQKIIGLVGHRVWPACALWPVRWATELGVAFSMWSFANPLLLVLQRSLNLMPQHPLSSIYQMLSLTLWWWGWW